ncbi:alpha-2-macroglobulin-like protein 1 [Strongylocentrotus purpuratus]|uniref:Alpha-2-macroglobulin n=1 Tax=Strongylocentrotus purpuratus TaxID=7668 RepID=A0A7M7HH83_STRPU|nr:alpha-2-macroglobulin-like protein 1 [Strongylocentrotus purpuratus]
MRLIVSLLIFTIAVMVRGQEDGDELRVALTLPPIAEEVTQLPEPTTTPALPLSPEELREEDFNKEISYLFLIPKLFYVQTKERICLLVTKSDGLLDYRVSLQKINAGQYEEYWSPGEQEAKQGENCFEFDVPTIESGSNQRQKVRLQLRRKGAEDLNEDGYEVTKERFVRIQAQGGSKTYVQTDKPIYQPGQTVRFRALTLNSELKTVTEPFDSVIVESQSRQRVNQWTDVKGEEGLIELEHELPDELPDGITKLTYYIKVLRGTESVTQTFTVEEYVLPRFEVEVITPPYILITDPTCTVKVCGTYTYGKPVQGSVQANITADGGRYDYRTRTRSSREVLPFAIPSTDADGCAVINVNLTRLELTSRKFYIYGNLQVSARFTETATGETLTDKSTSRMSSYTLTMRAINKNNFFKPALPYFGAVEVTNPDGAPKPGESIIVRCNALDSPVEATSNDQGFAVFTLPLQGIYEGFDSGNSLSCNVTAKDFQENIPYDPDVWTLNRPITYFSLSPMYSPTDNYLEVEAVIQFGNPIQVGGSVSISVHMTKDCTDGPKILAVSRGNILQDFEYKASRQESANGIIYDVTFVLTPLMTPFLDLLVFGILDDGEMIADSLEIESKAVFENEVHIQVADGQDATLEPGARTSIEIIASPGSLCAVGVVDKSVHILGGNNQMKTSDVVSFLNTFQLSSGDNDNPRCQDHEDEPINIDDGGVGGPIPFIPRPVFEVALEPQVLARKKRQFGFSPYRRDPYPLYSDVTREFEQLGLVRISNLKVETSPCQTPEPYPYYFRNEAFAFAAQADFAQALSVSAVSAGPAIRKYFPETWLWYMQRPEESPTVTVPDTITEWVGSGFCISSTTGFGISEPFSVTAFKQFFADYNLPYSVIRGEELELQINIFNYLEKCLPVKVTLTASSKFEIKEESNSKYTCVCSSSEPTQVTFNVRPTALGDVDLETTVIVAYDQTVCRGKPVETGVTHSDGLSKPILVEPEGEEVEESLSLYFCPKEEEDGTFRHTFEISVPVEYVADSGRVTIFMSGDILGNSLANIDRLLRIPSGCGEQNMIGFVPNIYALQYLQATEQADQSQVNKALSNMRKGYQKQLNYRRSRGSYSAFGNRDPAGSAWLTAYVIRSFAQASQFISIDTKDLDVSINWLYNTLGQEENGCFRSRGRVIHKEMQGGVNDEVTLTAFIVVSLLEAQQPLETQAIQDALSCITNSIGSLEDTYTAALIAYALSIAKDTNVVQVLEYLESVDKNEIGVRYWVSSRTQTPGSRRYGRGATASSLSIEMTAYVLLTYINVYGHDAIARGSAISKWLVSQQGPHGGFKSSQDTVVAIHALAEYARLVFGGESNLGIAFSYKEHCLWNSIFVIHDGNRLVLQRADLDQLPKAIAVIATGEGCALLQVIIRYNIHPALPPAPAFEIIYNVGPTTQQDACQGSFNLNVCVRYLGDDGFSNMAMVEVKLVTGLFLSKIPLIC